MYAYSGQILHVDLTQQLNRVETFDEDFARSYLGGNGFAAHILFRGLAPRIDPLSPENLLVFAIGPLTDTALPSNSRAYVATKSDSS